MTTHDVLSFELLTPIGEDDSLSACSFAMHFPIDKDAWSFDEETLVRFGDYRDSYRERVSNERDLEDAD